MGLVKKKFARATQRTGYAALSLAAILLSMASGMPAHAADQSQGIETVIVTAEKRAENLQNVAASVTAISSETLQQFSIQNFNDYAALVPGLTTNYTAEGRGITTAGLRGVSTINGTFISGQNTVGYYLDDSPVPVMNPHLTDVQRIEVLRGPQGTLYGSSSLAGTIKIVSKQPEYDNTSGWAHTELSSTEDGGFNSLLEGGANLPLGDHAALRFSAYSDNQDGYIDFAEIDPNLNSTFTGLGSGTLNGIKKSNANTDRSYGARAAIAFSPTDDLKITSSALYSHEHQDTANFFTRDFGLGYHGYFKQPITDEFTFADISVNWNLHWADIVSTTSYFNSTDHSLSDETDSFSYYFLLSGEGLPKLPAPTYENNKEWTHETRLISQWKGPLQFIGGVFYTHRENPFGFDASANGLPQLLFVPLPDNTLFSNVSVRSREELALFGEATYAVTDWLSVIGGLRWYDFNYSNSDVFVGSPYFVDGGRLTRSASAKASGLNPRVRVEVRPDKNSLLYVSATKGYRMGGPNYPLPHTPDCLSSIQAFFGPTATDVPSSFKSDSLWSYEAGAKTSWLNNHLTVNGSIYHIDWSNTQVPIVLGGLCPFNGESTNVGSVKSDGFEVEAQFVPFAGMNIGLGLSHIHERVAQSLAFPGATLVLAPKGGELPDVPEWQVSLLGQYNFPIGEEINGFVRGDYRYESSRLAALTYTAKKDAFSLLNLRAGADFGTWEVAVFADNVGNARPSYLGEPAINLIATHGIDETQRPRTIGLSVSKTF